MPEQDEYQRLLNYYRTLSDLQLQLIVRDFDDLTPTAQEAIQAACREMGLDFKALRAEDPVLIEPEHEEPIPMEGNDPDYDTPDSDTIEGEDAEEEESGVRFLMRDKPEFAPGLMYYTRDEAAKDAAERESHGESTEIVEHRIVREENGRELLLPAFQVRYFDPYWLSDEYREEQERERLNASRERAGEETAEEYLEQLCPQCQSNETSLGDQFADDAEFSDRVIVEEGGKEKVYPRAFEWKCEACGARWL